MNREILLPDSQYININLGLKYLNGNRKLYLKILNSFLTRYIDFNIHNIKEDEFKNEMHTLKGLSSTLGMESLSNLVKNLQDKQTEELLINFSNTLKCIISDLSNIHKKTLLIIDDNSDDIDKLLEILEDNYEIMVITIPNNELESLNMKNIDLVLLSPIFNINTVKDILKHKKVSIIEVEKPIQKTDLILAIRNS